MPISGAGMSYGWDGAAWRKLPLLWGYSDIAGEDLADTNLSVGMNTLYGAIVPAGEIIIVRQISMQYTGTPPTKLYSRASGTPGSPVLLYQDSPASTTWYVTTCFQLLEPGDRLTGTVEGATATDNLLFYYSGYKMKIAE